MKKTLREIKEIAEKQDICSVPLVTFMGSLSDKEGNLLQIIPGQGCNYYEKPKYKILTNFSPFKMDSEKHPWMGWDRYLIGEKMLEEATEDLDVSGMFEILRAVSQTICPTVVSMVFDLTERTVYWCEQREWDNISKLTFHE